jgi:PAS domain S-box-containing protein
MEMLGSMGDPAAPVPEAILDAAPDAVFTIEADGSITYLNAAAERMFGLSREEAIGRELAETIIPPDLRERQRAALTDLAQGGDPQALGRRLEFRGLRTDGAEFPIEVTVARSQEDPPQYTGFIRDLSAIKEDERERARMQRLLEKAEHVIGMGSFEMDVRTGDLIWSDELYRLNGYEPGEVEPTIELAIERMHPEDRADIQERTTEMFDAPRPMRAEYRIQLPDGRVRHMVADGAIERDREGEPSRLYGTVQDVTEQRLSERELQAHYALAQTLSDWSSFDEGVVDLLRRLGTAMNWAAAHLWVRAGRGDALVCRAFWMAPGEKLQEFERTAREAELRPGEGIVWRAWETREPLSVEDVATDDRVNPSLRFASMALKADLHTALLLPAVDGSETLAVIVFNGREPYPLSERLTRTLTVLGSDLGRFLAARRGELGPRSLSNRELEVLQLAAQGHSAPMIAEQLMISPATVKTHFQHTYEKLGVTDRAAAVAEAMRTGLIA